MVSLGHNELISPSWWHHIIGNTLQRRHNEHDSVSNHRSHDCLLNRGPVNTPHKWPVTRKMFPFDDVIMKCFNQFTSWSTEFLTSKKTQNVVLPHINLPDELGMAITKVLSINRLRPIQNCRHFADDIFKFVIFCENCCTLPTNCRNHSTVLPFFLAAAGNLCQCQ